MIFLLKPPFSAGIFQLSQTPLATATVHFFGEVGPALMEIKVWSHRKFAYHNYPNLVVS
jgi:hypothetical protein